MFCHAPILFHHTHKQTLSEPSLESDKHIHTLTNLPTSVAKAVGITSANVYITGNNLWLKTKYTGPDPEVTLNGESPNGLVQGLDFCTIPQPRSLIFGLNVTF